MTDRRSTVLVVDDDQQLADLYATWLRGTYDVRTAYGGEEALEAIDETVDVSLIDRRMPQMTGDEVLEHFCDRGYDCRVSIVTAVDPDFDIVEMGFDEYIVKPVRKGDLQTVVDSLVKRSEYSKKLQDFFALASKRAALQAEKTAEDLEDSDAWTELTTEFDELHHDLRETVDEMTGRDFEAEMQRVSIDA